MGAGDMYDLETDNFWITVIAGTGPGCVEARLERGGTGGQDVTTLDGCGANPMIVIQP